VITSIVSFFALKGEEGHWHHLATGGCTREDIERVWKRLSVNPDDLSAGIWYEVWQVGGGKVHVMAPSARTRLISRLPQVLRAITPSCEAR
jgi:hypothetical protein